MENKIISFGSVNGKPIEWIVLEKFDLFSLVIAKKIVGISSFCYLCQCMNDAMMNGWENSIPRDQLNDEFYNSAFSASEKKYIVNTVTNGCCKDNVFLLSLDQAKKYMNDSELIKTDSIKGWWLSTVDNRDKSAWNYNDKLDLNCDCKLWGQLGLRPALKLLNCYCDDKLITSSDA